MYDEIEIKVELVFLCPEAPSRKLCKLQVR